MIAELESEKATFELNAEQAGTIKTIAKEGDTLNIGDIVCSIDTEAAPPPKGELAAASTETEAQQQAAGPSAESAAKENPKVPADVKATPVAAAIIADKKVDVKGVTPSGSNGKIVKQDVMDALNSPGRKPGTVFFARNDRAQEMSNLRKTISRRLVEAKNTTAMHTTFSEVDMSSIKENRK